MVTFHLIYYTSLNLSSCLECVPIYQETVPNNIANLQSNFTVLVLSYHSYWVISHPLL